MHGHHVVQHELNAWLPAPKFTERVYHHDAPRVRRGNPDSKPPGLAEGDPLGAPLRIIDVLQDASRIAQEHLSGFAQSHASRQSVEQHESHLSLEILNLPRQRRLRDMQSCSGSPEMLLFSYTDEIAKMPELH